MAKLNMLTRYVAEVLLCVGHLYNIRNSYFHVGGRLISIRLLAALDSEKVIVPTFLCNDLVNIQF